MFFNIHQHIEEDLPLLAQSFISQMNKQTGKVLEFFSQGFDILNGMEMTGEIVFGGEEQVFKLEN